MIFFNVKNVGETLFERGLGGAIGGEDGLADLILAICSSVGGGLTLVKRS
jgi:hypothetical protein